MGKPWQKKAHTHSDSNCTIEENNAKENGMIIIRIIENSSSAVCIFAKMARNKITQMYPYGQQM